jgi:hypothetical protein
MYARPYYQRVFTDDLSAGGQLRWAEENADGTSNGWRPSYLGSLRFDSLLSRELVVADSHLFDGRFFPFGDSDGATRGGWPRDEGKRCD